MDKQKIESLLQRNAVLEKELAAKNRELAIEAALDKVRTRAMAMKRSDELKDLIATVSVELAQLDFVLDRCSIIIFDTETKGMTWWMSHPETPAEQIGLFIKYHEQPPFLAHVKAWEERQLQWQYILEGEVKKTWDKFLFSETELSQLPAIIIANMRSQTKVYLSASFNHFGGLFIATLEPLSQENFDILLRFAKVFDQTYTRFNDLKLAEAQAREAKIEATLESVRSRSLAMHKSNELKDVITVVLEKLKDLGLVFENAGIQLYTKSSKDIVQWVAAPGLAPAPVFANIPYTENDFKVSEVLRDFWKAKEEGINLHNKSYSFEEKNRFFDYAGRHNSLEQIPVHARKIQMQAPGYTLSLVAEQHSALWTDSYFGRSISVEGFNVLKRTAKVFEQAYLRFLDLQKAEAQAREARIEVALERLRSKAMAMPRSGALNEILQTMYVELKSLDESMNRCFILIFDVQTKGMTWWMAGDDVSPTSKAYYIPYSEHPPQLAYLKGWEERQEIWHYVMEGEEKRAWDQFLFSETELVSLPDVVIQNMKSFGKIYLNASFNNFGCLTTGSVQPLSQESFDLLRRFAKVFDLSYTRFNDLKLAEAQAQEAKIELALERVRATAMAMHSSTELREVVQVLFEKLREMDFVFEDGAVSILVFKEGSKDHIQWAASRGQDYATAFEVPYTDHSIPASLINARESGVDFFSKIFPVEEKNDYFQFLFKNTNYRHLPDVIKELIIGSKHYGYSVAFAEQSAILIPTNSGRLVPEDKKGTLKRFASVFDQAFIRFLDLQRAEAQAREAQIQLALERVRARTMAMQKSNELPQAASLLFQQVHSLGLPVLSCGYNIWEQEDTVCTAWMSDRSGSINPSFKIPLTESPVFVRFHESRQRGESFYAEEVSGDALAAHYRYMLTLPVFGDILNGFFKAGFTLPESQINNVANFSHGNLIFITYQHVPEAWDIFKRFAKVFDLTYTRFNDLKQAEAQAQKARIEAALERVRARAMSMQNSDELNELVTILFEELIKLDLVPARCIIWIFDSNTLDARVWMANAEDQSKTESCHIKRLNHPYYEAIIKGWKEKTATWVYDLHGEDKRTIDRLLLYETELSHLPEAVKKRILTSERTLISGSFNNFGLIEASGPLAHSDEQLDILYRFGKVFDLSYTRFNDLKQAEAQAKEAKIEAALERVRSKALAMQTSDDLIDVANVLREQMGNLGQPELDSSVVHLYNGDSKIFEAWYAYAHPNHSAEIITGIATVRKDATAWTQEVIDKYQSMETDYTIVSSGQKLNEHYKMLAEVANATVDYDNKGQMIIPEILYYHFSKFSGGALLMISNQEPSKESRELQKRAAAVFDLAYTRFNDLKQAEARARESKIEASLDRVRAEIASMRTTTDLEQLTPLIWNELTNLGVPFTRCGVFIMDKEKEQIQTYLSTPEGKAIAAFQLPFHTKGITEQVVRHWQSRQLFTESWDGATFMQWASSLVEQGILPSKETYLTQSPPQQLTLHFVPFLQGMLYVGNSSALNSNALDVVQAIADAFSTAYARYEDFRKLEAAKQQVEQTLTELKSAQVQLIQKEKMASLGELTAGIAHEIQNPLNFVNNFSELNKEMLAELKEEINKGNYDEVMVIAHAIDANEEKINYHGKRADAIVKGMLQHSRKNTGEKQSTDINALCDEYLRLSYHGLRAKDKTFNATLKTFFDETIDKVNIVPQDIGRVLLNLFNNAFYAVHEHLKKFGNSYDPTVLVSTKKLNDRIEIVVKDNGMGISKSLTDKIFQPFFTTKHTGQGTGLGLSLSYDIIKAHGGELNVLTEEGEGAAFIIELPLE